jgi:hypothetical protein
MEIDLEIKEMNVTREGSALREGGEQESGVNIMPSLVLRFLKFLLSQASF